MTLHFNGRVDVAHPFSNDPDDPFDHQALEVLSGFSPVLSRADDGNTVVDLTVTAPDLRAAVTIVMALVAEATGGARQTGIEVIPTAEFDRRQRREDLPKLASVTQASKELGISRQAVLKRLAAGSLQGEMVGDSWVVFQVSIDHLRRVLQPVPDTNGAES